MAKTPPTEIIMSSILLIACVSAFKPSCFSGVEVVITEKDLLKPSSWLHSFILQKENECPSACFIYQTIYQILILTEETSALKLLGKCYRDTFNLCSTYNSKFNLTTFIKLACN
jgi:hypothetical protein